MVVVELALQAPFTTVQRRTEEDPMVKPVTPLVGLDEFVIIPEPDNTVQVPAPEPVAFKLAVVALHTT